ncbi:hypothetical protein FOA52_015254 [Chlamydomonas sp. UWO 241]|nr:hypothetical protein FOA52_015254 [Chlamydomonas sp. UWO 241]
MEANGDGVGEGGRVLFSACKGETFTHKTGFKQLYRRLRSMYRPEAIISKDDLTLSNLSGAAIVVFGCPREKFSTTEFTVLRKYVESGGSVLIMMAEGGEMKAGTNINYWLEEYGMSVNADSVLRTTHYKYMHPKEVLVSDGILNRGILDAVGKGVGHDADDDFRVKARSAFDGTGLEFVFPHGCTVSALKPAIPVLSSGKIAYPMNRPLGAIWSKGAGKICVLGSAAMFDDKWIDKEENSKVMDFVFKWLRPGSKVVLNKLDAEEPDVSDLKLLPDTQSLADKFKGCLQEVEDVPRDWTTLFDDDLFKFDTSLIPEAVALYERLSVKKAPLGLIPPQFDTPLPPLQPAVFPPAIREPPPPALELFDLDENFASEANRLAYLTNKCAGEADLEYYILEAGHIMGMRMPEETGARAVLGEVFRRIAQWKMGGSTAGGYDANAAAMGGGGGGFDRFEL